MRGRIRGKWEAEGRALRRVPWIAVAASNPAQAIEELEGRTARGQIAVGAVGIASVTVASPLEVGPRAVGLLEEAPEE
jgi:hypothetical protein